MTPVGGVYSADFGPFVYLTVADNTAPSIEVIIVARDIANNETKTTVGVVVNSLAKCFG